MTEGVETFLSVISRVWLSATSVLCKRDNEIFLICEQGNIEEGDYISTLLGYGVTDFGTLSHSVSRD